ncbi:hypothetical protein E0M27_17340 [Bacillus mycoides]|nr:hypothetical protein E0M27_17340 [Bacillus mycoides]
MKNNAHTVKKSKDLDQFHECKANPDGLQSRCKLCNNRTRNTNKKTMIIPIEIDGKTVDHRYCKACEELKPLDQFVKNGRGGRRAWCSTCLNEKHRKSYAIRKALKGSKQDRARAIA